MPPLFPIPMLQLETKFDFVVVCSSVSPYAFNRVSRPAKMKHQSRFLWLEQPTQPVKLRHLRSITSENGT